MQTDPTAVTLTQQSHARHRLGLRRIVVVFVASGGVGALLGVGAVSWLSAPTKFASKVDPASARQVAIGGEIYARRCAVCHGKQLEGQPDWQIRKPDGRLPAPPHDMTSHTWHHSDQLLFEIVKHGLAPIALPGYQSDMPAFAGVLTDEEIWAVLAFIKSTWPEQIRERQRGISEASGNDN